ncbi:2-succinyl-5-enolpyruvyl-6-hydroxy-3-cyclohexene-1-carboxylic-acid synthase [Lysinimonas soli]|uniref:2-succinyl-5-enolpyruvyl-6-hydroxy-3-cyclohexene-1-carboxylate synthase n=1 Tax=Lysinimonas soli TaxID=1074233 RepID=A0ABW0NPU9_9MICO
MTNPRTEAGASSPASAFATALLAEFLRLGVTDLVLSPGSRSQALALAAARFERAGLLRLRVRIDERSAGFLALGIAVETGRPVLLVTTSGTAVANLHPAVLEAAHSGVPLVVLSADRPAELRGIGSNQTTVQPGIFAAAPERSWDVAAPVGDPGEEAAARSLATEVLAGIGGPRHVNLAFREPLSSTVPLPEFEPGPWQPPAARREPLELKPGPGTVVVAGSGAGDAAEAAARALGAPLLAEVASGARFGPNLVAAYRELLGAANFGDRIERVVVFGHPTLSREVPALIQRDGVETIVVRGGARDDYNPGHRVAAFADAVTVADDPAALAASRSWVGRWVAASRALLEEADAAPGAALTDDYRERAAFAKAQLAHLRAPVTRRALVSAVWNASWPHDRLVLASSRLIRELDRVAPGKKIPVHSNRGLAGIDGTIATATGIALAQQSGGAHGITRVLLGDLAMLHDAGSLLAGVGEERPRMQLIVGNDGGGTIFDGLEVAATADPALLERVMLTPQSVDLAELAAAYGWGYRRVGNRGELDPALTPGDGQLLIEVPLER